MAKLKMISVWTLAVAVLGYLGICGYFYLCSVVRNWHSYTFSGKPFAQTIDSGIALFQYGGSRPNPPTFCA